MNRKFIEKIDRRLAAERGTSYKNAAGKLSIALAYPNRYAVGMSSLGFQGIYGLLNRDPEIVCERVFLPEEEEMADYLRSGTELVSYESKRPLNRFDIIAFSVSFENDYPNVLRMLDLGRIPRRNSRRNRLHPLVILGGVCAFFNPEPIADFFDLCFVGEAEETLPRFLGLCFSETDRRALLRKAAAIDGIYAPASCSVTFDDHRHRILRACDPGFPATIRKTTITALDSSMRMSIIAPEAEFSDMHLVEVMRGCPWSCRFCVAGQIYRPVRRKDRAAVDGEISDGLVHTSRVGLVGPSLTDYPAVKEVLTRDGVDFSITSLRASRRSAELVALMQRHRSVSIAPEAGTERLRRVIDKRVTEEDIVETSRLLLEGGIETLRLYFMIGLPTETGEDVEGIVTLTERIRSISKRGLLALSVSTFVPKPFTPFQWHPMGRLKTVRERLAAVKKGIGRIRGARVLHDVPKYACMQALFALGDRRCSAAVEHVADRAFSLSGLPGGIDPADIIYRQKELTDDLPWDFIDAGVPKERLWDEYRKALSV